MLLGIQPHNNMPLYHEDNLLSIPAGGYPLLFPSFLAANTVDMTLKVAACDQRRQNKLFKGWNGAGVKPQPFLKLRNQMSGQHHIAYPEAGGYGFGKTVQIDHIVIGTVAEQRFPGFP